MSTGFDPNWLPVIAISIAMSSVMLKCDLLGPWRRMGAALERRWMPQAAAEPSGEETNAKTPEDTAPEPEVIFWRHRTTEFDLTMRRAGLQGVDSPSADILSCEDPQVQKLIAGIPGSPCTADDLDSHLACLRVAKRQLQARGEL